MATTPIYARIDTDLKENAESILRQLGISPSSAIQMLYSQIVLTRGLPLKLALPDRKPLAIEDMSQNEISVELMKGIRSLRAGSLTTDEVDTALMEEFGI